MLPISVVIGTYNGAKHVEDQIQSIFSQSLLPAEIIVSDDCSTDNTIAVVERCTENSSIPVRILKNQINVGFGENFLRAAEIATSPLVAFSDQDDVWRADKLAICAPYFNDQAVVLTVHSARLIDAQSNPIGRFSQFIESDGIVLPLRDDPWGGHFGFSMVVRKSLLHFIPYQNFRISLQGEINAAHDRWISILARTTGKIVTINQELVDYRQHTTNVYGAPKSRSLTKRRKPLIDLALARAKSASDIISLLAAAAEHNPELPLFDKASAIAWWEHVHTTNLQKARLYSEKNPFKRSAIWTKNVILGVYRNNSADGFDKKAALKDFGSIFLPLDARAS